MVGFVFKHVSPCFNPLQAWQGKPRSDGKINVVWKRTDSYRGARLDLPCGKCVGCRLERSRQWAVRCIHEAKQWDANCFITLTYDDQHLPSDGSLSMRDFQLFMKKLRKKYGNGIRFFHCGEYGGRLGRPHYHAILFNHDFSDKVPFSKRGENVVYISKELDNLWGKGFGMIGSVTYESAAYVARYVLKKVSGENADLHYGGRVPEYVTMSRRPGIGRKWFDKFGKEVYSRGGGSVIVHGKEWKPPRFYDNLFALDNPEKFLSVRAARLDSAPKGHEASLERLAVKEQCANARLSLLKRSIE